MIVSPIRLDKGAVYTVQSEVADSTVAQLRAGDDVVAMSSRDPHSYTQLSYRYPTAEALAEAVTASNTNTCDQQALIGWIGAHTRYSSDIPSLPPGGDTVDRFLFGGRAGFFEQIWRSLAVMFRSIGVASRESVGYVHGQYNPVTDLTTFAPTTPTPGSGCACPDTGGGASTPPRLSRTRPLNPVQPH